ncbi:MAG TPA: ABC transporter substrate-binding protein [Acidimicrobiales bacterium]|jgi:branched-chain amino acid transport system substrate-binding protein
MRSVRHGAVAVLVGLALVATACGSSSKNGGDASSGTTLPAPTGTVLPIGWVGTLTTGPAASTQASDVLEVWVKWANSHGGVNGHPVKAFYKDDKGDPALGLTAVKELVETDHVIAIVAPGALTEQTWADYVKQKNVPVVHGSLIDALWFTNPMFYPLGGTVIANIWGQMKAAAQLGAKTVGIVLCTDVAACAQAQPLFNADAKQVGLDPVYNALASRTQPSYTAECLAAKNAGAEAMAAFIDTVVFSRDCSRQNYHPIYISSGMGPTAAVINTAPDLGNTAGSSPDFICLDTTIGPAADFNAALKAYGSAYAPGGSKRAQVGQGACDSWVGGVGFAKAITNANVPASATATSADVIKGLSMFQGETLGGLTQPLTLSDGTKPNPQNNCIFLYKWKGTVISSVPSAGAYTCQPPTG